MSIGDATVFEGNLGTTAAVFTVSLSAVSAQTVTVQYTTVDGSAGAPGDYTALALSTLTFLPGETVKTITVDVLSDTAVEPDEMFFIDLSNPSNATIADGQGAGTILNDDSSVVVTPMPNGGATFTDMDGDPVVVKVTKGALSDANFVFDEGATCSSST